MSKSTTNECNCQELNNITAASLVVICVYDLHAGQPHNVICFDKIVNYTTMLVLVHHVPQNAPWLEQGPTTSARQHVEVMDAAKCSSLKLRKMCLVPKCDRHSRSACTPCAPNPMHVTFHIPCHVI